MAKRVIVALDLELPTGTDISSEINSAQLNVTVDPLLVTNFEGAGWAERLGGIKDYTLSFTMHPDASNTNLNTIFNTNLGVVLTFTIHVDGGSAASAANASIAGKVLISEAHYGAGVGAVDEITVSLPGSAALTYTVS